MLKFTARLDGGTVWEYAVDIGVRKGLAPCSESIEYKMPLIDRNAVGTHPGIG